MAQCQNQTKGGTMNCYKRDYDLLGYKYALMSQLATAGLNNVICMIPARDEQEFNLFPKEDVAFIHDWLGWTDARIDYLKNTVPLPGLDEVGLGLVDGSAAFAHPLTCSPTGAEATGDAPLGFIWLFNPGYLKQTVVLQFDDRLSPWNACRGAATSDAGVGDGAALHIDTLYPVGRAGPQISTVNGSIEIWIDGSSAIMLQVSLAARSSARPTLFGVPAGAVNYDHATNTLELTSVVGEMGTVVNDARVRLPAGAAGLCDKLRLGKLVVNSVVFNMTREIVARLAPSSADTATDTVTTVAIPSCEFTLPPLQFGDQTPFPHAAEVALTAGPVAPDGNATFTGSVSVPAAIFAQLKARDAAYPVAWGPEDADASWLEPGRLLLFLQLNCSTARGGACDDKMPASLTIDGVAVPGIKAYESRCTECTNVNHPFNPNPSVRFNGWYWDVSVALKPDTLADLTLAIPQPKVAAMVGLFFENTETVTTDRVAVIGH